MPASLRVWVVELCEWWRADWREWGLVQDVKPQDGSEEQAEGDEVRPLWLTMTQTCMVHMAWVATWQWRA
jgi:hypothetical protein